MSIKYLIKKIAKKLCDMNRRIAARNHPSAVQADKPEIIMDNRLLHGKNVLIVGIGENIGLSIAVEMASQGANIYFLDVDEKQVNNANIRLAVYQIDYSGYVADVSDKTQIDNIIAVLSGRQIFIDVLVNNAVGPYGGAKFNSLDMKSLRSGFETNFFGPIYLTKIISQQMIDKKIKGVVIFMTSIHQWSVYGRLTYSTSKAALGMLIKELAVDLAPYDIRVNGIAPGWVKEDEGGYTASSPWTVLHKESIKPCYIGRAAVYLASDYFSYCTTGTVLKLDAGLSLGNHIVYDRHRDGDGFI